MTAEGWRSAPEARPVGVEPFEATYGAGFEAQEDGPEAIECEVAEDGGDFRLHEAVLAERPDRLCFVDGVMRTEARLTRVGRGGEMRFGLAGSWAAGAVVVDAHGPARIAEVDQGRVVVFSGGEAVELPRHQGGWEWTPLAVEGEDVAAARDRLRDEMRAAEAKVAARVGADGFVVVFDGPLRSLRRSASGSGQAMGYVKTHHRRTLPAEEWRQVPNLQAGQRTSLFAMPVGMYACYVRVGLPGPWAGGWAGVARLEVPQDAGLEAAAATADKAAAWLPAFATALHRNARAPVNLTPVAGLEKHLRRLLGNPELAVRAVREAVVELNRKEQARVSAASTREAGDDARPPGDGRAADGPMRAK